MTARQALRTYLAGLRRRLLWHTTLRGAALLTLTALIVTVLLALALDRLAFASWSLWSARGVLLIALVSTGVLALARPLSRLDARRSAARAERALPQLGERLLTFAERDRGERDEFLELLATDTLGRVAKEDARSLAPDAWLAGAAAIALACAGITLWLVRAAPGGIGHGAAALWRGNAAASWYAIRVLPGNATVRRHGDQLITAQPASLVGGTVQLYARYVGSSRWERVSMQAQPQGSGFQFLFAGIGQDLDYYVEAGAVQSTPFHLRVTDVPAIRHIGVSYHYPAWMQRPDRSQENSGDVRAVQGTQARLEIVTDRPLVRGSLVLDDGRALALADLGHNRYRGELTVERDGAYHLAMREGGQAVRLSEDYFIEAGEVKPPQVAIVRPMSDYRASPIEEVTLSAQASDAFGITDLALHYSVNGGPEQTVSLPAQAGALEAQGTTLLALERWQLVPGDIVSFYASARDARAEARTDIAFIQIDPFEREFSQSQQTGGGGGGAADNQASIVQRQKEVITATWAEAGLATDSAQHAAQQAKFLGDVQGTLRSQSLSLAGRLQMRGLNQPNEHFSRFEQEMEAAAQAMDPAGEKLHAQHWHDALGDEQRALQHLMRAEATFREIEVAFGSLGSGAGNSAGRDLASLFDLELDTQKNTYETRDSGATANAHQRDVDEALRKLDELARRQSELAVQRAAGTPASAEQRWQQEMLRRNADAMRRELEQLARSGSQSQSGSANGTSSETGSEEGEAGAAGSSGSSSVREALEQLRRAEDAMRAAVDQGRDAEARRAAEQLRDAIALLGGVQQSEATRQLDALRTEAARLAQEQRRQTERLRRDLDASARGPFAGPRMARGDVSNAIDSRQRLADDMGRLQQGLRDAERETLQRSHDAAAKVRDALADLDESDVQTRLQRSADLMRRGYNPGGDPLETQVGEALERLQQRLGEARQILAQGPSPDRNPLDTVQQLRERLAALDPRRGGADGRGGDARGNTASGAATARGDVGGPLSSGQVRAGGSATQGPIDGAWNTGDDPGARARGAQLGIAPPPRTDMPPADPERAYRQSLDTLGDLRRSTEDADAKRQVEAVIRAMQNLDPRRFPGNPAMVEELYARVLTQVDQLELSLRQAGGAPSQATQVRSEDPLAVPSGYRDSVADYFRRLSRNP